ncbi:MAG: hypothetical protein DMF80_04390 [Acidobacteria bacterium]|nr:MAG: hypothetical protein DMF80_04390 [Acidobacteriota bacterium]PYQ19879.1 MAG: hypothetical protein DMF81_20440 [Acidobacteriota bacterium]
MRRRLLLIPLVVLVADGCHGGGSPAPSAPSTVPSAAATPAPAPPTPPPAPTQPVSLTVKLNPNPANGPAPLTLHVALCGSRPSPPVDDYPLTFTFTYGDGARHTQSFCRDHHTYPESGTFRATFCATDGIAGHESCGAVKVRVD